MEITKQCMLTGDTNTMDVPVTQDQLDDWTNGSYRTKQGEIK